ncbi:hypothetical protein [Nostoc sp. KVJ20]|uniref:hypothetical protein n=1 Tax=Nostoc sp. KVJ20 TaxID=457944 RepID=UPI000A710B49|nr:hypothetical protein [Nostoc sp. KVJ20]
MVTSDILVVDFVQQDDVLKLYPEAPLLSSDKAGWDGIQLQYHRHPPHQLAENYSRQHRIIIHDRSPSPPMVEEMIEHRFQKRQFGYGDVTVVPADILNSAYWNTEYEFITLSFEARTFAHHTFDLTTATDVELVLLLKYAKLLVCRFSYNGLFESFELPHPKSCNSYLSRDC